MCGSIPRQLPGCVVWPHIVRARLAGCPGCGSCWLCYGWWDHDRCRLQAADQYLQGYGGSPTSTSLLISIHDCAARAQVRPDGSFVIQPNAGGCRRDTCSLTLFAESCDRGSRVRGNSATTPGSSPEAPAASSAQHSTGRCPAWQLIVVISATASEAWACRVQRLRPQACAQARAHLSTKQCTNGAPARYSVGVPDHVLRAACCSVDASSIVHSTINMFTLVRGARIRNHVSGAQLYNQSRPRGVLFGRR